MERENKAAKQDLLQSNTRSLVSTMLKDQVSSAWLDVAVDKVTSSIVFEDSKATIHIDNIPYSLTDGVSKWISQDGNKRFLPPKATQKSVPLNQRTFSTSPGSASSSNDSERMQAAFEIFNKD